MTIGKCLLMEKDTSKLIRFCNYRKVILMLRPTAVKVTPEDNFFIKIEFDTGEIRLFDVKPYIKGAWYEKLRDESYFRTVTTDGYTVMWPDGQDLCPDEIYDLSQEC